MTAPKKPADLSDGGGDATPRAAKAIAPDLYAIAENGPVAFQHIAQARRIRQLRKELAPQSRELEQLLRKRFVQELAEPIMSEYYCARAYGGCALTEGGRIFSVLNTYVSDLVEIEGEIKQLNRDALRMFASRRREAQDRNAQVREIGETLYSVMTRVMATADVFTEDRPDAAQPGTTARSPQPETSSAGREDALAALHREWDQARERTMALIQREARFEYFTGVLIGVALAVGMFGGVAALAVQYWQDQVAAPSLVASTVAGAVGAAVSVTQRMSNGTLVLDYTASRRQKLLLGAARPFVGSIFACVVQFALLGGLLTMQNPNQSQQTPATFAFFAMIGFASGFSERFATDILERAGSVLTSTSHQGAPADAGGKVAPHGPSAPVPPPPASDAPPPE